MPSELSINKGLLTSKPTESRWLIISNLPKTATEEAVKECFQRHGHIQSVNIDEQHFASITFSDIHTATKAHNAENILDQQKLRTAYYDGSNLISKILLKPTTTTDKDRDKCIDYSPEENTRHQVVPIKHDSNSSGGKQKITLINNSRTTVMESPRQKYEHSASSNLNYIKTRILKIYPLSSKMSNQLLRETLRNIFADFQKSSHLLTIKIINDYALLTFQKSEDVHKALLFIITKSIDGIQLNAEPYENEHSDLVIDEYSIKATRILYIGNLRSEISPTKLREKYSAYGDIIEIEIKRRQQQTFAFIQYTDIKSVVKAIKAFESKIIRDHSIKLRFGKTQPTNILWLDNLPSNITESTLYEFLNRFTNFSSNEILDVFIDHRNCQTAQCLVYFIDIKTAENAMNLIRGKKFQSKRIQIDFVSEIFLTRFSDIIQQKKSRCSKVSDSDSSLSLSNISQHLPNRKKIIKSDTDEDANTERIFDWLRHNHHSDDGDYEHKKELKRVTNRHRLPKKIFQTKDIPLQSDSEFIHTDVRLKVYSSLCNQSINPIHLPLPQFAKCLMKPTDIPIILNPKAHLKHFSLGLNNTKTDNDAVLTQKELDKRIRLLDEQMRDNSLLLSTKQTQSIETAEKTAFNARQTSPSHAKHNFMSSPTTLHSSKPAAPDDKSPINLPSSSSDTNNNSSNILSMKLLERLGTSAKLKRKTIPPPLSVITTLTVSSNINDSSPPGSITPNSTIGNQNHSPATTFSPISQQQLVNNSSKPTVLKSILKQSSASSQSASNETRKTVHIISTTPPFKTTINGRLPLDNKKESIKQQNMNKPQTQTNKSNPKLIKTVIKPSQLVKGPLISPLGTKVSQSLAKYLNPKRLKTSNQLKQKPVNEINKKSSSSTLPQPKKPSLLNHHMHTKPSTTIKQPSIIQKSVLNSNHNNKISKNKFKLKQNISMYDRIKKRSSNENIPTSFLSTKIDHLSESVDDISKQTKNKKINTFDTEENGDENYKNKINPQQLQINSRSQKRPLIDDSNEFPKKIKLQSTSSTSIPKIDEAIQPNNFPSITETQQYSDQSSLQTLPDESTPEFTDDLSNYEIIIISETPASNSYNETSDKSTPHTLSDPSKPSYLPTPTKNQSISPFDSPSIKGHTHLFPQILTPDSNIFTPHHQHFPYPLYMPSLPDSPPLSTSSCSSIIGNPFYNIISNHQHSHDQESRRDSITTLSATSPPFRNPTELYSYSPQILNNFQSCDPYFIQWEGYLILKTDHAYIKTQLIAGNPQIALLSINYWNLNLNHNLRISQRMRLDEIQLDGVQKRMQMSNDHCILIAQPNGLTPDEICSEQNRLKNRFIQYLIEKQAAGIVNILLPGVIQPVYIVHIFPPCKFASDILQKRAPDAYRCVVQNKLEQIYLLFIITSTNQ